MKSFYAILVALLVVACGGLVNQDADVNGDVQPDDSFEPTEPEGTGGSTSDWYDIWDYDVPDETGGRQVSPSTGGYPASGGSLTSTGGVVSSTGGSPASTGGMLVETGGSVPEATGGSQVNTGGHQPTGGMPSTGGALQPETAGSAGALPVSTGGSAGEDMDGLVITFVSNTDDRIVVPAPAGGPFNERAAEYEIVNNGAEPRRPVAFTLSQVLPSGQLANCDNIHLHIGDAIGATFGSSGGRFVGQEITFNVPLEYDMIQPGASTSLNVDCVVAEPVPTRIAQEGDPKSGDVFALKVTRVVDDLGEEAVIHDHEPAAMVLRKAMPIITWEEIEEPLHDGMNEIARIRIESPDQSRPVGLQQLWFFTEGDDFNMLTPSAVQVRLTMEHPSISESVTWEWDGVTPEDRVAGHSNERGLFIWEEAIPDLAYHARVMFYRDEIATPVYDGLVGPMTVSLWAEVQQVHSGSKITTDLLHHPGSCPEDVVTTSLVLFNGNGLLSTTDTSHWGEDAAGVWWSDLSEGTDHLPMDWSSGAAETPVPSSPDYSDECLVPGSIIQFALTAP